MPINVKLLKEVEKLIKGEPRKMEMSCLLTNDPADLAGLIPAKKDRPPCGTVGCIAGWAYALTVGPEKWEEAASGESYVDMWEKGREFLGLNDEQAERLFSDPTNSIEEAEADADVYDEPIEDMYNEASNWPLKYAKQYRDAKTPKDKAKAVSDRIKLFIESKGKK